MSATEVDGLSGMLAGEGPVLVLAPMQDVTDLPFWRLMRRYGGADLYYTEYFRVHADSKLERHILRSLDENPTGRPVVAQMIGNDVQSLVRSAQELEQHGAAGIDLNLGCPAPVVYRKCAGGGLLRELARVDEILAALRETVKTRLTVKTRVGFADEEGFDELLGVLARHRLDLVTVHGRTVLQRYRPGVRYDLIRRAVEVLPCPVVANGDVFSPGDAVRVLDVTGVWGLMLGRGVIRNPWLFSQIKMRLKGEQVLLPTGREVMGYVRALYEEVCAGGAEMSRVHKMKRYLNYLGQGLPGGDAFLYAMRRAGGEKELFAVCAEHLDHEGCMELVPLLAEDGGCAGGSEGC
jgi:tRNA-dihydrouridine synthase B